jgi:hypothetical protein
LIKFINSSAQISSVTEEGWSGMFSPCITREFVFVSSLHIC